MVDPDNKQNDYRMWIGNLDQQLTEYALLKILQNYKIEFKKFDFVYQRSGPNKGKSMGFCFLTVPNISEAEKLIKHLDGKRLLGKCLSVKPANAEAALKRKSQSKSKSLSKSGLALTKTTLTTSGSMEGSQMSEARRRFTIREIERKLKAMEEEKNDVSVFASRR